MKDVIDIIDFYKKSKISDFALESELSRQFNPFTHMTVVLDKDTTLGQTNASYVAMVIPEKRNDDICNTLVLDKNLLLNALTEEQIAFILKKAEMFTAKGAKRIADFVSLHRNTECGFNECISLYLTIYNEFIKDLFDDADLYDILYNKTLSISKLHELELAIDAHTEKSEKIVEYVMVNKLLPEQALTVAEELFKRLNIGAGEHDEDIDHPVQNYWYGKMAAQSTGIINPEFHQDLDPFYLPKY